MSLADYQPLRRSIPIRGGEISVRGLSLDDVAALMHDHLADLDSLFNMYQESAESALASASFIVKVAREAPALVGLGIALAADEPTMAAKARQLSLPIQIEIIKVILELTFEEAGGARKFFESLSMLLKTLTPAIPQTASPT